MRVLDFGKNSGKVLADCEESYLKWLVNHEKVLAERNRWASRDAKFILERRTQVVVKPVKPIWSDNRACWIDSSTKKPVTTLGGVPYWNEQDGFIEHPEGKLWNEWMEEWVEPVPPKKLDLGLKGNLYSNKGFSILR